jgi:hypothetical protein
LETHAPIRTYEPAFHADDEDPSVEYRSLSVLAVVSLITGLAAPLCFIGPLLMVVPLVGAAVSIVALRQINGSAGALAGRWLAATGLALSVGSIAAYYSRDAFLKYMRANQAAAFSNDWIKLVQSGNLDAAFRLTVAGAQPRPQIPEPGMPAPEKTPLELFKDDPIIKSLVAAGPGSQIECSDTIAINHRSTVSQARQRFQVTPPRSSAETKIEPVRLILDVRRDNLTGEIGSRWLVSSYEPSDPLATAPPK